MFNNILSHFLLSFCVNPISKMNALDCGGEPIVESIQGDTIQWKPQVWWLFLPLQRIYRQFKDSLARINLDLHAMYPYYIRKIFARKKCHTGGLLLLLFPIP